MNEFVLKGLLDDFERDIEERRRTAKKTALRSDAARKRAESFLRESVLPAVNDLARPLQERGHEFRVTPLSPTELSVHMLQRDGAVPIDALFAFDATSSDVVVQCPIGREFQRFGAQELTGDMSISIDDLLQKLVKNALTVT